MSDNASGLTLTPIGDPNGKSQDDINKGNESPNNSGTDDNTKPVVEDVRIDNSLNEEYTDISTVTIMPINSHNKFREANRAAMSNKVDFIGSSIKSSRTLSSNETEMSKYMPNILGVSPNDSSFMDRIKTYFNNIQIKVDEIGKKFDTSFIYNTKRDYISFSNKQQAIEDEYKAVDKTNTFLLKQALAKKIIALNVLESSKCTLGRPVNVEDYLMYRHCLLYDDVCKDNALLNSDRNYRFKFRDDKQEANNKRRLQLESGNAKANYVKLLADKDWFDAVYIEYCLATNVPISLYSSKDRIDKEIDLDRFSVNEPIKFNKIVNDRDVKIKATIEQLILRGDLVRTDYNQNISDSNGEFIAANMKEAITWYKNPDNKSVVNAYLNKLKQY